MYQTSLDNANPYTVKKLPNYNASVVAVDDATEFEKQLIQEANNGPLGLVPMYQTP